MAFQDGTEELHGWVVKPIPTQIQVLQRLALFYKEEDGMDPLGTHVIITQRELIQHLRGGLCKQLRYGGVDTTTAVGARIHVKGNEIHLLRLLLLNSQVTQLLQG